MIDNIIFLFTLLLIHGVREGYTWASSLLRTSIWFSRIDYHGWRAFEYLCIWGALDFRLWVLAVYAAGQLPYNAILHRISKGSWRYIRVVDFRIFGIYIPCRYMQQTTDAILSILGVITLGVLYGLGKL